MDLNSLLIIIIVLVAAVAIAVGIYLILVLIEARQTLREINKNLARTESILSLLDEKVVQPAGSLVGVLSVIRQVADIIASFTKGRKAKDGE